MVHPLGVFLDHAAHTELRCQRAHGLFHAGDPVTGQAVGGALVVVKRDNLVFQGVVEAEGVAAVLLVGVVEVGIVTDSPAVAPVVTLPPPAVQNAQIKAAMAGGFHAARAGSLERPARVIQPNVAAGHHLPRDVHVVILEEHQMPAQLGVVAHMDDFLDHLLSSQ